MRLPAFRGVQGVKLPSPYLETEVRKLKVREVRGRPHPPLFQYLRVAFCLLGSFFQKPFLKPYRTLLSTLSTGLYRSLGLTPSTLPQVLFEDG